MTIQTEHEDIYFTALGELVTTGGRRIAIVGSDPKTITPQDRQDAERLAACWNACKGMKIETLQMPEFIDVIATMAEGEEDDRFLNLVKTANASRYYLKLLEDIEKRFRCNCGGTFCDICGPHTIWHRVRQAIGRAK